MIPPTGTKHQSRYPGPCPGGFWRPPRRRLHNLLAACAWCSEGASCALVWPILVSEDTLVVQLGPFLVPSCWARQIPFQLLFLGKIKDFSSWRICWGKRRGLNTVEVKRTFLLLLWQLWSCSGACLQWTLPCWGGERQKWSPQWLALCNGRWALHASCGHLLASIGFGLIGLIWSYHLSSKSPVKLECSTAGRWNYYCLNSCNRWLFSENLKSRDSEEQDQAQEPSSLRQGDYVVVK